MGGGGFFINLINVGVKINGVAGWSWIFEKFVNIGNELKNKHEYLILC